MLILFTLELLAYESQFDKKPDTGKRTDMKSKIDNNTFKNKFARVTDQEKYEKSVNFIILLPLLVMLFGIKIMSILYELLY